VVQWLHDHRTEGCTTDAMDWAAINGHLHMVQWLHEHRTEGCTKKAMGWAAENGHQHMVEWLQQHYDFHESSGPFAPAVKKCDCPLKQK
jgi:hypothetical protein